MDVNGAGARGRPKDVSFEGRYALLADEDLMPLVEEKEAGAFEVLYDRHASAAYSLALRLTRERQTAEDLVQEAFVKIWRSAGTYRPECGSVRTWVLAVVRNGVIDGLRRAASRHRALEKAEVEAPRSQPCEAFAEAWRDVQREEVRTALRELPTEQREVVELSFLAGRTHPEIAAMLGIPLGTVKGRLRLGLKKARDALAAQAPTMVP